MSRHPTRTPQQNRAHDAAVHALAKILSRDFQVLADHVNWTHGRPPAYGGHVPDLVAVGKGRFLIEVEDCATFSDEDHTRSQLTAFEHQPGFAVYCVVPPTCPTADGTANTVARLRELLVAWGLPGVHVATFDAATGRMDWNP